MLVQLLSEELGVSIVVVPPPNEELEMSIPSKELDVNSAGLHTEEGGEAHWDSPPEKSIIVSSGPSIVIRMSFSKLTSLILLQRHVFTS